MFIYIYSLILYLGVFFCNQNRTLFLHHLKLDSVSNNKYSQKFCKYCIQKWSETPIGNASEYTKFLFTSRKNSPNYNEIVPFNNKSVSDSGFDLSKDTKVLINGWIDTAFTNFTPQTTDAYLAAQDVNIIVVDWSQMAEKAYPVARVAVDPVGQYTAQFLDWLVTVTGVLLSSVHLVGHSLGAHVAGVAGSNVRSGQLTRITGLDPAGPGFGSEMFDRLDPSDAKFVDVIHTARWWAGYHDPCGHVDFYPNGGGPLQPGCHFYNVRCSHRRSYKLFVESISSEAFVARECSSWSSYKRGECNKGASAVMGEHVDLRAKGKFYLRTAGHPPYALGNHSGTQ